MTLREYLIREEIAFGRKDISKIGSLCLGKAKQMGVAYKKKWQQEPYFKIKREYFVIDYPESFLPAISEIIKKYFSDKEFLNGNDSKVNPAHMATVGSLKNKKLLSLEGTLSVSSKPIESKVVEKKKRPRIKK